VCPAHVQSAQVRVRAAGERLHGRRRGRRHQWRGSTGSLSRARMPKTPSWTRGGHVVSRLAEPMETIYSRCHSSLLISASRNNLLRRAMPISARWGLGSRKAMDPLLMNSCFAPGYGPSKPSRRRYRISSCRLIGPKGGITIRSRKPERCHQ
jgi:hypothetical protein